MKRFLRFFNRTVIWNVLRIGFILFSLYYIITRFDWPSVITIVKKSDYSYFLAALAIYLLKSAIDAARWKYINNILEIESSFLSLLKYTIIAPLFDLIVPAPQGEDFFRYYAMQKDKGAVAHKVLLSIFFNRYIGLVCIAVIFPFSAHYFYKEITSSNTTILRVAMFMVFLVILAVISNQRVLNYLLGVVKKIKQLKIAPKTIDDLSASISAVYKSPTKLFLAMLYAFASQLAYACCIYCLVLSITPTAWPLDVAYFTIPIIYMGAFLPVSIGGLGIKEGIIIWAMVQFGYPADVANSVGVLHLSLLLVYWVLGLLLYAANKDMYRLKSN